MNEIAAIFKNCFLCRAVSKRKNGIKTSGAKIILEANPNPEIIPKINSNLLSAIVLFNSQTRQIAASDNDAIRSILSCDVRIKPLYKIIPVTNGVN